MEPKDTYRYFDRDLSWLSFNERILMEAARPGVPVGERLNFLGIFSANLDEFYRVRMPAIMALKNLPPEAVPSLKKEHSVVDAPQKNLLTGGEESGILPEKEDKDINAADGSPANASQTALLAKVRGKIDGLQNRFGLTMLTEILPDLAMAGIDFKYNAQIPTQIDPRIQAFFYEKVAAYLQLVWLPDPSGSTTSLQAHQSKKRPRFFPQNDQIYLAVSGKLSGQQGIAIINVPSSECGRFMRLENFHDRRRSDVWLLDDIIRMHMAQLAGKDNFEIEGSYSFKLSRDADIDYKDEYGKDLAGFIQKQIGKRNFGLATRLLYDQQMPPAFIQKLRQALNCPQEALVSGGRYHNLKALSDFPLTGHTYEKWPAIRPAIMSYNQHGPFVSLLDQITKKDVLISTPYQDYSTVLRFFNEAAIDPQVRSVAVTLYRIASDSLIAQALMSAAKNGKSVTVFVELKARFDEANNIKWARKMQSAGVKIVYSIWALKVHAKIALVKRNYGNRLHYSGIVATGNFNENTARVYADYILMTADKSIMADIETLMLFLEKRARPDLYQFFRPKKLLVAGFNLKSRFLQEIQRCSAAAREGQPARITIKLNNLEEQKLIDALYDASSVGVEVRMMVRSICRLIPGIKSMSENIKVYRLVDRYLEHARVFIFDAAGRQNIYIGSADWMNRNVYRRIEVCCPVSDPQVARLINDIVELQFSDQLHLVQITGDLQNKWILSENERDTLCANAREAQLETYKYLRAQATQNDTVAPDKAEEQKVAAHDTKKQPTSVADEEKNN